MNAREARRMAAGMAAGEKDEMTVKELRELLSEYEDDRVVVLASDAEGNNYSPCCGGWSGSYLAYSTWSGEMGLEKLTDEDREAGYSEEDVINGVPALCLRPVN